MMRRGRGSHERSHRALDRGRVTHRCVELDIGQRGAIPVRAPVLGGGHHLLLPEFRLPRDVIRTSILRARAMPAKPVPNMCGEAC